MFEQVVPFIKENPYILAPFLGLIPALIWLWFWLKEDIHPEPVKMITLSFLGGMLSVVLVLPLQKLIYDFAGTGDYTSFFLWATLEEIFKFSMVYFIALSRRVTDEPVDTIIYMIISALGFVAMENTLFLIDQIHTWDLIGLTKTGGMRFIGASLLHIMTSGTVGIFMAFSFYKSQIKKYIYIVCGLLVAIILHTLFNISIMNGAEGNIFLIFLVVWIGIIVLLLLFEKIKHITKIL